MSLYRSKPWNVAWGEMGYAQLLADQSGITTITDISGLSVTFMAVAGREYKTTVSCMVAPSVSSVTITYITDGVGTQKQQRNITVTSGQGAHYTAVRESGLPAGSTTRKARLSAAASTTVQANAIYPAFIIVEDVGPA